MIGRHGSRKIAGFWGAPLENAVPGWHHGRDATPGILPFALRASLRLFKIAPGDFVEPLDLMARLAALVPTPRVNLTRYHGVFAPNHRLREQITPSRRGQRHPDTTDAPAPARHLSMTWAQRLKRVFKIDIETGEHCGGAVKVIASIEYPAVIKQILDHLERRVEPATPAFRPFARAPPPAELPGLREHG